MVWSLFRVPLILILLATGVAAAPLAAAWSGAPMAGGPGFRSATARWPSLGNWPDVRLTELVVDSQNPSILYAGTDGMGFCGTSRRTCGSIAAVGAQHAAPLRISSHRSPSGSSEIQSP